MRTTSPGLSARPPGMFSAAGIRPTSRRGSSTPWSARNRPSTAAPPDMSYFILFMFSRGLSEIPPVSNVTPLPITTTVRAGLAAVERRGTGVGAVGRETVIAEDRSLGDRPRGALGLDPATARAVSRCRESAGAEISGPARRLAGNEPHPVRAQLPGRSQSHDDQPPRPQSGRIEDGCLQEPPREVPGPEQGRDRAAGRPVDGSGGAGGPPLALEDPDRDRPGRARCNVAPSRHDIHCSLAWGLTAA